MENKLSSIEEIIQEAKQGRMFILVDDEGRENEGDLVIPAQFADAEAVNFMAKYGRGLICLAMEKSRVEALELPLMAHQNKTRHQTAFTVSIEAREGVTTGISASDRAKTISAAINPDKTKYDIVSPGHVFPLVARDGGVLVRAGHTEAAVDISRIAGLNPSGVICEIMNEDGTMARLPELVKFASQHNLKIATIADLIEYRRAKEKLVERVVEQEIETDFAGKFKAVLYRSKLEYAEHLALVKGEISKDKPALVRMHQLNVFTDVIFTKSQNGDNSKVRLLQKSLQEIDKEGSGVLVLLRSPDKNSLGRIFEGFSNSGNDGAKNKNASDGNAKPAERTIRDYGIGAQILLDLGVREMNLISNTGKNPIALEGYGLSIKGFRKV